MTAPHRQERLIELFAEASELAPADRAPFLDRACGDDTELRAELEALLRTASHDAGDFLTRPAAVAPETIRLLVDRAEPDVELPSSPPAPVIDGYTDFVAIGEGGMGTVFRAQQVRPVRRTVAIKVIRPGTDSGLVLQRFEAEQQALARMAHPFIAAVHDAGRDRLGRPYLAMEFVDGRPINEYCDRRRLPLDQRLELFAKVCDAVDHAHRRGVLHRDLKPCNVLVTEDGDEPMPKVIDFGIAKATEDRLGEHSIHTEQGSFLGTPEYMSPEQIAGDRSAVDTRTDVYSLGVMLYELLTGALPFASERLRQVGLLRMGEIVRDETPPKPSTALRHRRERQGEEDDDDAPRTTMRWLTRVQGDLDQVVMKALDKDPEQRYPAPRDLAEDLRRFLRNLPVLAGPPSGLYRLRRFARRYRIQLSAAALVLLALTTGLVGTLWFLFESKDNEARAVASARDAEGTRLAATAALVSQQDPNLGMLLAVEAGRLTDDFSLHETILGAVPQQDLVVRFGHSDYGTTFATFLDAQRLLSCGLDTVFWISDPDTGAVTQRFAGHRERVTHVAASPAGDRLVSGSFDGTARLWDAATGRLLHTLPHEGRVERVAWPAGGERVWTLSEAGVLRSWAADTGDLVAAVATDVHALQVADDGASMLTGNATGTTTLRDRDGAVLRTIPPPDDVEPGHVVRMFRTATRVVRSQQDRNTPPWTELLTATGERIALHQRAAPVRRFGDRLLLQRDGTVLAMSLVTGEIEQRIEIEGVQSVFAISDDGRYAIAHTPQQDMCVADLQARRIVRQLSGENEKNHRNRTIALHPDGDRFAMTGRQLLMWRLQPEFAPFDLPVAAAGRRVRSLSAAGEAVVLLEQPREHGRSWSLWSIDGRRKLRDLPLDAFSTLELSRDGTQLQGLRLLPPRPDGSRDAEVATFDLEGHTKTSHVLPCGGTYHALRAEGDRFAHLHWQDGRRTARVYDLATGALLHEAEHEIGTFHWGHGPDARTVIGVGGSRTRTGVVELTTGRTIARITGPAGAGHYGAAVDEQRGRLLVVLGDLRARTFDLRAPGTPQLGEYARLVRSNGYDCGFLPDGSMAWVHCSNEVHLFDAATCRPFATIRLRGGGGLVAARADASELVTVTGDGRCQRWPLDTRATARRLAAGALSQRELDLFRVGTPSERVAREEARLAANPTPRNLALLGELQFDRGDLDGAVASLRRACTQYPLASSDRRRYRRWLELQLQRLAAGSGPPREPELADAEAAVRACLERGGDPAELARLPGFELVRDHPGIAALLAR
jgi:serine/threonine protein kinase/WD40 repeat protein